MKMKEEQIFNDLLTRFILTLPNEEYSSFNRIFVYIQQAHWFYCDYYVKKESYRYNLYQFGKKIFESCCLFNDYINNYDKIYKDFLDYLSSIKVCGVILLNNKMNKVVLVQGYDSNQWTFPKGKIDQNETEMECAIRESLEEIGYDVSKNLNENDYIQIENSIGKITKLFIVNNVPENIYFITKTRNEIKSIKWFNIEKIKTIGNHTSLFYDDLIKFINKQTISKDNLTFGESKSWNPDEMYKMNEKLFGVKSTYNRDDYY